MISDFREPRPPLSIVTREDASATEDDNATEDAALGVEITVSAEGYADDTYMLMVALLSLLSMLVATSKWLKLTSQEINAKKSLAFSATNSASGKPEAIEAALDGVLMPVQQEFRQLGVGVRTVPRRGTGPLLQRRIGEGKTALKKARTLPVGFDRKATVAAVMIVAATLFGVELADISLRDISSLETAIMIAMWGPSRPCTAKELVFALLLPGHRVLPSMVVPYKRMCWLAQIARTPGTAQIVTQAIWERTTTPKAAGPLGQALWEFRKLGWQCQGGWWQWAMLHREAQLAALEKRRPRTFGAMGAPPSRADTQRNELMRG